MHFDYDDRTRIGAFDIVSDVYPTAMLIGDSITPTTVKIIGRISFHEFHKHKSYSTLRPNSVYASREK